MPDRVSNPGPLTYESGAVPISLRGPATCLVHQNIYALYKSPVLSEGLVKQMNTLTGVATVLFFFFCLPSQWGPTLKERICSYGSKFFPFRVDPILEGLHHPWNILCNYDIHFLSDDLQWEATKTLYREMLLVFEKIILPTYASCHVQFIMFYLCSLKPVSSQSSR